MSRKRAATAELADAAPRCLLLVNVSTSLLTSSIAVTQLRRGFSGRRFIMAVISGEVSEPCTLSSPTSGAHRLLTRLGASPPLHPFTGAAEICAHSFWYNRACGGRDLRQIKWESR